MAESPPTPPILSPSPHGRICLVSTSSRLPAKDEWIALQCLPFSGLGHALLSQLPDATQRGWMQHNSGWSTSEGKVEN